MSVILQAIKWYIVNLLIKKITENSCILNQRWRLLHQSKTNLSKMTSDISLTPYGLLRFETNCKWPEIVKIRLICWFWTTGGVGVYPRTKEKDRWKDKVILQIIKFSIRKNITQFIILTKLLFIFVYEILQLLSTFYITMAMFDVVIFARETHLERAKPYKELVIDII